MEKDSLVNDMEVQFAPEDHEAYGAGWYTYSELAIISMRGQDLIRLEATFGVAMPDLMRAFRADATYANMACAWIAAGQPGEWKNFNPLIMQAQWREKATEDDLGKSQESDPEPGGGATVPLDSGPFVTTPDPGLTS